MDIGKLEVQGYLDNGKQSDADATLYTDFTTIAPFTSGGSGTGVVTQETFDGKSCVKLYCPGTTDNAFIYVDKALKGPRSGISFSTYFDQAGTDNCMFLSAVNGQIRLLVYFKSTGVFVFNGATFSEAGSGLVEQATWQNWKFDLNWAGTVDVYLNAQLIGKNIACKDPAGLGGTNRLYLYQFYGAQTSYVDWCRIRSDFLDTELDGWSCLKTKLDYSVNAGTTFSQPIVSTYSLAHTTTNMCVGGILAPNGDIHFVPRSASVGQKISASGMVSTYSLVYTITNAYMGGVLAPNGDIHFVPLSASVGQKISRLPARPFPESICLSPHWNKF